ncbi:MAG TPA: hypothetical protein VNX68_05460, partial [Nitrosopumilaceae archaeon]|nr:hypothetical protein [Nitrosopumilaceae archaeon]
MNLSDKIRQLARQMLYQKDPKSETWRELVELYGEVDRVDKKSVFKKGDKGEKGDPGKDGINGINGSDGRNGINGLNGKDGMNGKDGIDGQNGKPGEPGSPDTPQLIADKINTLTGAIDFKVLFNVPSFEDSNKNSKGKQDINQPARGKLDQRWHGGGLATISHDATLTGLGTPSSPLSVVPMSTGVSSLNGMTGAVTLAAGSNISLNPSGNTITISSTAVTSWGQITGTLSNQTDLQSALNAKQNSLT